MISTGGEGKVSGHKRLRGKIGNPYNAPELKTFNLMDTSNGSHIAYHQDVLGVYISDTSDPFGVWKPIRTIWPPLGNTSHSRIGKRIKVKYLRIKGYVASSPFLITQVRWRLVLYRTLRNLVNGIEVYNQAFLSSLYVSYRNPEDAQYGGTSAALERSTVHNFYESIFNQDAMKVRDCKRRVLVKGLLKPSADIGDYKIPTNSGPSGYLRTVPVVGANEDTIAGQAAGTITRAAQYNTGVNIEVPIVGEYLLHNTTVGIDEEVNAKAFFPIDVTVTMNDNIDVAQYTYIFVFESDWGVGQNTGGYYGHTAEYSNYMFSFVPQIYYTDD